jgi:hypothetical protein
MKQQTLTAFEKYGKTTRRAQFLAEMEQVVPWTQLCALIKPVYPKGGSGEGGRPPVPLERMPRIYLLQLWFNLSDPAVEEGRFPGAAAPAARKRDSGVRRSGVPRPRGCDSPTGAKGEGLHQSALPVQRSDR